MNILTGERAGEFHELKVLSNGAMTDILSLISEGGGTVTSATLPLSISSSGVLSIDLSSYYTSNEVDTHLTGKADSFTLAAPLSISGGQISIDLSSYVTQTLLTNTLGSYATTAQLATKADSFSLTAPLSISGGVISIDLSSYVTQTSLTNTLGSYATTAQLALKADSSAMTTALAGKQDVFAAYAPLSLSGGVLSINLSGYASDFQVATPLSINTGTTPRTLGLDTAALTTTLSSTFVSKSTLLENGTGPALQIADGGGTYKALSNNSGALEWNSQELATKSDTVKQISSVLPLTTSLTSARTFTIESLWKPSQVTCSTGLIGLSNDSTGTLSLALTGNYVYSQVNMVSANGTNRAMLFDNNGNLVLNKSVGQFETVADHTFVQTYVSGITAADFFLGSDLFVNGGDITMGLAGIYGRPKISYVPATINYVQLGFEAVGSNAGSNRADALTITRLGSVSAYGSIGNHSDTRLKDDQQPLNDHAVEEIFQRVQPYTYTRNDLEGPRRIGFLAQDFISDEWPSLVDVHPGTGMYTLEYSKITALLWKRVQQLTARIDALESK